MVTLANRGARPGGMMSGILRSEERQPPSLKCATPHRRERCSSRLVKTVARRMPAISGSASDKRRLFTLNTRCDVAITPKQISARAVRRREERA
jgi:hypothetical protein